MTHGMEHTTPLIDKAIERNTKRLMTEHPNWASETDIRQGLTNLALDQDMEATAIALLDKAVPLAVSQALLFL